MIGSYESVVLSFEGKRNLFLLKTRDSRLPAVSGANL